jgi:GGDEF domain-containing protein
LGRIANPEVHFDVAPAAEDKTQFELTDRGPAEGAPVEALTAPTEAGASGEGGPQEQAVAKAPEPEGQLDLPTGLQDPSVMERLLQSAAPFHGVAVAIGINDYQSLKEKLQASSDNDSIGAVNRMIQSLLRPQDFAVRFVEDEYILLYPGESGAAAQRRLFQVSEKLWDFQLRSLGHLSVMFSWGGLEVANETVAEAVASARERMYQTKRNRKSTADIGISRRRVVNG